MPKPQKDPFPENLIVEKCTELTGFIDLRISKRVVEIHIFFKKQSEKAVPTRKNSIIKHGQPIKEKYLTRESVEKCEIVLCEHQYYILVKIVAYH